MTLGIERGEDRLVSTPVRHVIHPLAALVLHDFALEVEFRLVHCGKQEPHPVGVEPQGQRECIRREIFVVVRPVLGGRAVVVGPCGLELLVEHSDRHVLRAHEHDVLEQVRKAGAAGFFVTRPDLVPGVDGDDRRRVILVENYLEAVRQRVFLEPDLRNRARRNCGARRSRTRYRSGRRACHY